MYKYSIRSLDHSLSSKETQNMYKPSLIVIIYQIFIQCNKTNGTHKVIVIKNIVSYNHLSLQQST